MKRRLLTFLIVSSAAIAIGAGLLFWRVDSNASDVVSARVGYLIGARTGMARSRPIWICTYALGDENFERSVFVSEGTCPPRVKVP